MIVADELAAEIEHQLVKQGVVGEDIITFDIIKGAILEHLPKIKKLRPGTVSYVATINTATHQFMSGVDERCGLSGRIQPLIRRKIKKIFRRSLLLHLQEYVQIDPGRGGCFGGKKTTKYLQGGK